MQPVHDRSPSEEAWSRSGTERDSTRSLLDFVLTKPVQQGWPMILLLLLVTLEFGVRQGI